MTTLVLGARGAEAAPKRLVGPTAVGAGLRRLNRPGVVGVEPAVHLHVAAPAQNGDVAPGVVAGVGVPVVPLRGLDAAPFAGAKGVELLGADALGRVLGAVALPRRVVFAAEGSAHAEAATEPSGAVQTGAKGAGAVLAEALDSGPVAGTIKGHSNLLVGVPRPRMLQASRGHLRASIIPGSGLPNAYGAVWQRAIRSGLLAKTGRTRPSRQPGKNAHEYPVYRSLVCKVAA
jgi:hypothetical protein